MAKSKSGADDKNAHIEKVRVKSRAYGTHFRAKRGTYKKAKLNAACKKQSKQLISANRPSKILKDAIAPYRDGLEGGPMWSNLLSMFNKQVDDYGAFDFGKVEPFEVHPAHPLGRFLTASTDVRANNAKSELEVSISYGSHPWFPKSPYIDGYKVTVIGIFPDLKKNTARTVAMESEIMGLKGKAAPLKVQLAIPKKATTFLICIKMEGCSEGEVNDTPATMGMRMVRAGMI